VEIAGADGAINVGDREEDLKFQFQIERAIQKSRRDAHRGSGQAGVREVRLRL
jgi:hypothetical protein